MIQCPQDPAREGPVKGIHLRKGGPRKTGGFLGAIKSMTIDIDGLATDYIDQGQGPTILLLHGWAAPIEAYRRIIDKLSAKYRVLAPQAPGSGKTPEPAAPMTIEDYVSFTAAFCRALGVEDCILMGHSNGGRIILSMLARPDPPVRCQKVVLIDSAGVPPKRPASYYVKIYSYKLARKLAANRLTRPLFGGLYESMRQKRGSADYRNASEVMKKTLVNLVNLDLTPLMPQVRQNTLLIWGDRDQDTPLWAGKVMEQKLPESGLAVIQNAGHFPFADNWPQFSAVLDAFL